MRHIFKVDESVWNEETRKFMKDNCRKRKDGKYVVESNFIDVEDNEIKLSIFNPILSSYLHVLTMNEKNEVVEAVTNTDIKENKFHESIKKLLKSRILSDRKAFFILINSELIDNLSNLWVEEIKKEFIEKGADIEHLHGHFKCGGEEGKKLQQAYDAYRVEENKIRLTVRVSYSTVPCSISRQYDFLISGASFEIICVQKDRPMYNIVPSKDESSVLIVSNEYPVVKIHHQFDLGENKSYEEISKYLSMYLKNYNSIEEVMLNIMTRSKYMENVPVIHDPWGALLQKETVLDMIESE